MDIEQLKLILDAAAAAGGGATKIIIMWFGYKILVAIMHYGLFAALFYTLYRIAVLLVHWLSIAGKLRDIIGHFNPESSYDVTRLLTWVRERHKENPIKL